MTDTSKIREAIIGAKITTSNSGETPDWVYVPPAHKKVLQLDSNLIVGARGVGKSFWTAALNSEPVRKMLDPDVRELANVQVYIGFSVKEDITIFPDAATFQNLIEKKRISPYDVWHSVILRLLVKDVLKKENFPCKTWEESATWVKENPEPVTNLLQKANEVFVKRKTKALILFDSLDRSSNDWKTMDSIVRDLLRVVLRLKSYPHICTKVFLREDQASRTITDFPDSSKLKSVTLDWELLDFHGLLWMLFCNAPDEHGETLRTIYKNIIGKAPEKKGNLWSLDNEVKNDPGKQAKLFEFLAGEWMGGGNRKGKSYTWVATHLADSGGQASPRSFLAAIQKAAEVSSERYSSHPHALHYDGIKRGVQVASGIRIDELAEDYPWVQRIFEPLRGLTVPCEFEELVERWKKGFPKVPTFTEKDRLPPQHAKDGWEGIRQDIEDLKLFEKERKDKRVNMPDLYRIGFGLKRKGGVKPTASRR